MEQVIITAAVTGSRAPEPGDVALPRTPRQIVEAACAAHAAGAAIVHVHARAEDGIPTQDPALYRDIVAGITARCDVVINLTTSGRIGLPFEERVRSLELCPEMASFDAGSLNFGEVVFLNPIEFLRDLALRMRTAAIKPELEIFDVGMIDTCLGLAPDGLLVPPLHFQFVLGVRGGAAATAANLVHMASMLPAGSTWSVTGIGRAQVPMALMALAMGGHVRVGLEDTAYYAQGVYADSNAQLVERIVRLAQEAGRPIATPDEARALLGLRGAHPPRPVPTAGA